MSREEALVAVCNAARAVRQSGLRDVRLDQLYAAVDAVDSVDGAPLPVRPGLCQGAPDCWRRVEIGTTCFQHSAAAQKLYPWEQIRRRDPLFQGGEADG